MLPVSKRSNQDVSFFFTKRDFIGLNIKPTEGCPGIGPPGGADRHKNFCRSADVSVPRLAGFSLFPDHLRCILITTGRSENISPRAPRAETVHTLARRSGAPLPPPWSKG